MHCVRLQGEFRSAQGEWTPSKGESRTSCSRGALIPLLQEGVAEGRDSGKEYQF